MLLREHKRNLTWEKDFQRIARSVFDLGLKEGIVLCQGICRTGKSIHKIFGTKMILWQTHALERQEPETFVTRKRGIGRCDTESMVCMQQRRALPL